MINIVLFLSNKVSVCLKTLKMNNDMHRLRIPSAASYSSTSLSSLNTPLSETYEGLSPTFTVCDAALTIMVLPLIT